MTEGKNGNGSLAAALAAFQGEDGLTFPKTKTAVVKTRTGGEYTYKYADLGDILPVVRPLLAKHGLSWSSKPSSDAGEPVLRYRLLHASGEEDAGSMPLGVDKGCRPQELGSAITYARRYALTAQLNLATEEDDDAQAAQGATRRRSPAPPTPSTTTVQPTATPAEPSERAVSAEQRGLLNAKAHEMGLSFSEYARAILMAAGVEPRDFESEEQAQQFVYRQLDRLPARLVDILIEAIADVGKRKP